MLNIIYIFYYVQCGSRREYYIQCMKKRKKIPKNSNKYKKRSPEKPLIHTYTPFERSLGVFGRFWWFQRDVLWIPSRPLKFHAIHVNFAFSQCLKVTRENTPTIFIERTRTFRLIICWFRHIFAERISFSKNFFFASFIGAHLMNASTKVSHVSSGKLW